MAEVVGFAGVMRSGKTSAATELRGAAGVLAGHVEYSNIITDTVNSWLGQVSSEVTEPTPDVLAALQSTVQEQYGMKLTPQHMAGLSLEGLGRYLERRSALPLPQRKITPVTKETHRPVLQWLGHQMCEVVDPHFWTGAVGAQVRMHMESGAKLVTVGGVRFPWDADMIHDTPGSVVEVVRPGIVSYGEVAEGRLEQHQIDATVHNDGSREDLRRKMGALWNDVQRSALQQVY